MIWIIGLVIVLAIWFVLFRKYGYVSDQMFNEFLDANFNIEVLKQNIDSVLNAYKRGDINQEDLYLHVTIAMGAFYPVYVYAVQYKFWTDIFNLMPYVKHTLTDYTIKQSNTNIHEAVLTYHGKI